MLYAYPHIDLKILILSSTRGCACENAMKRFKSLEHLLLHRSVALGSAFNEDHSSCESRLSEQGKQCSPKCQFFRCSKRALDYHSSSIYCKWTGDDCIGPACNYVLCSRYQLLPDGTCGLTIKRRTVEEKVPEEEIPGELKKRILRRVKNEELI